MTLAPVAHWARVAWPGSSGYVLSFMAHRLFASVACACLACTSVEDTVAAEAVASYDLAKKSGDKTELCVRAGLAAAAFNQAKNEAKYLEWKKVEQADCAAVGMPK
jgi:hypothetical protein